MLGTPRTDPSMHDSRTRLPPRVDDVEAPRYLRHLAYAPSAFATRVRHGVRCVLCWFTFPSVPALGSTGSATEMHPALFVGFTATMARSDFLDSSITGFGSSPSRYGPGNPPPAKPKISRFPYKELPHMPVSSTTPGRTGARITRSFVLPSMLRTMSAPGTSFLSRLYGWPMRSPVNASLTPSRMCSCMTRGRCGSLLLQRGGLSPPTLCRFYRRTRVKTRRNFANDRAEQDFSRFFRL